MPPGFRPVAVAVLLTLPASTSPWVIAYGVWSCRSCWPRAPSVVAGQVVPPTLASLIATVVRVCVPVFPTRNV